MKKRSILMITGLALIFAAACSTESEDVDEFEVLSEYMVDNNLDLTDLLADGTWITTASAVFDGGVENYFIVDLRGSDKKPANGTVDFEDGHIPGANLVTLGNVLTYVQTNNTSELPVVVVCYSGQTAGHAVTALKLSGIPAKVLKWGMSSWNSEFDVWSGNTGSVAVGSAGWDETDDVPALPSNTTPTLDTGHDDGADILADRVQAMLDGGFKSKTGTDIITDYTSYNVINFWAVTDWELYGHVKEAYQVTPGTLTIANDGLKAIDPDSPNVIYCWTGQTASVATAFLTVLGYESYDLLFSANGLVYDNLTSHKWSAAEIKGYAFDIGN